VAIESFLVDLCTVARYVDRDEYGDKLFGPSEVVRCRHERGTTQIRDADGDTRASTDSLATVVAIGQNDRVWLPGRNTDDVSEATSPISVRNARSSDGRRLSLHMTYF